MIIREMKETDAPEVAAIEEKIFSQPWSADGFRSSLSSADTLYLVVECDGQIAGYCGFLKSFDEADITDVAVSEACRGKGIGYQMLTELMRRGRERGIARFTLEVRVSNASAIHLYEKLGFASVGIRKNFYERPREDAMIMWTEETSV